MDKEREPMPTSSASVSALRFSTLLYITSRPSWRSFPFDSRNTIERDIEYVRRKANERVAKQKLDNNYDLFS